jgi:GTPase SAR1 family protein
MDIARQIAEVIVQLRSLSPQSNLLDLEHLAVDLSHYQCSNAKIIGVLGNSGEGKSTIINSLLNYPELACTGDSGIACTSLISEYRYKKPEHTAPIHIEVERLSEPEIHELVNELVWNYRKLYLPDVKDKTTKEYEELERESNLAWSTLNTAFGHKEEFNKKMIELDSQDGLKKVTSKLTSWTMELEWPKGEGDDPKIWKATAQDAIECCKNTEIFMKDRFWPFTKIVRVYLDSPLLRAGIVLADMPGLQDTNLARVRMTQEYFIQCNTILVVAGIARAVTNQSLKSLLNTVLSRDIVDNLKSSSAHHSKLAIVCARKWMISMKRVHVGNLLVQRIASYQAIWMSSIKAS